MRGVRTKSVLISEKDLIFIFILLSASITLLGFYLYQEQSSKLKHQKKIELSTIATLKVSQIEHWRQEQLKIGNLIMSDQFIATALDKLFRTPSDIQSRAATIAWLANIKKFGSYCTVALYCSDTTIFLMQPDTISGYRRSLAPSPSNHGAQRHEVFLSDLLLDSVTNKIRLYLQVPLFPPQGSRQPHAFVVMEIDPSDYLYPLIQSWPTPSRSAEVLLVRKDRDKVVYLNQLRHIKNSALTFQLNADKKNLPAAMAALGMEGLVIGKDYRNKVVLAYLSHVSDSRWHMVAKIDTDEIYQPLRIQFFTVLLLILSCVILSGVTIVLYQRHKTVSYYKNLYHSELEKNRLSSALERSEQRYRTLFNGLREGVAIHRIIYENGTAVNYEIIDVNPSYLSILNIDKTKVLNKKATEVYGTASPPYLKEYAIVAESRTPFTFETYFPPMDKYFFISAISYAQGLFVTVFFDITDHKRMEKALSQEKERLSVTLRSIGDAVISTDIEGRVQLMNNVAEKLTGWNLDEARGKPLSDIFVIIDEFNRKQVENPVEKVLKLQQTISLSNNTLLISRTGTEYSVADSCAPILDGSGKAIGVVLVFRDNTENTKIEQQAIKMQKLESLGLLASGIAHDFNNLLSGMFGYIESAAHESEGNPSVYEKLTKCLTVFNRTRDLTAQLLTFAKGGVPVTQVASIEPVLRQTTLFALTGSNIAVQFYIPADLWLCEIDASQITQVFDNLIINAKQAMPHGGTIFVNASNTLVNDCDKQAKIPGRYVCITITDFGIGIAREHIGNIFDPFFTTKKIGSGLGLTVCHSIVSKHNGYIDVESVIGQGSTFSVYLPASESKTVEYESIAPQKQSSGNTKGGKILVMDDEETIRDVASMMLRSLGYECVLCSFGEEVMAALGKAARMHQPFDCIILDLTIPGGVSGKDTARTILRDYPESKIIASSGYSDDPVMSHPTDFGFIDKITKPYSKAELAAAIARVVAKPSLIVPSTAPLSIVS
ncbi:MAG: response regulator [Chitinivibrionales bacterium]|nr:response regulator [Chitinivibrionales bacterium]